MGIFRRVASWALMALVFGWVSFATAGGALAAAATAAQISVVQTQASAAATAAQAADLAGASNATSLQTTSTQLSTFASDLSSGKATTDQASTYVSDPTALAGLQSGLTQAAAQTPAATTPANSNSSGSGSGSGMSSAVETMVSTLTGQCWSCDFYSKVITGMDTVFQKSYAYFEGLNSFMGFVALSVAIVLCWKVVWFFTPLARDDSQTIQRWEEIIGIFLRTIVVFTVFLSAAGLQMAQSSSNLTTINPVRDLFFDGPLAAGTSIGCDLAKVAGPAASQTIACSDAALGSGSSSWLTIHVTDAVAMLKAFHVLGVKGIGLGMRTALAGSGNPTADIASKVALMLAGLPVVMMFVGWTISFGLRYIDVALRAMISLALFPIFAALWIFDTTRPISHMAMKSVFFMMALFSVSGLTYVMALEILNQGLLTIVDGTTVPQTLAVVNSGGGGGFFPGLNAIAITVGSWGVAIGVASMSFKLAEEMVSYEGDYQGEMGVGAQAGAQMTGAMGNAAATGAKFLK